jgi:hypothetical protein
MVQPRVDASRIGMAIKAIADIAMLFVRCERDNFRAISA